ncbi:MAG: hypothetical protein ACI9NC_002765, partial [Verrucomicrobiales bacterium]
MNHKHDSKKRSASFDGDWNDEKESELSLIKQKLEEWEKAMIAKPEQFSPETMKLIARVASKCAWLKGARKYAEFEAVQMEWEPQIKEFVSAKLSEGRLTRKEFARYSKVLRDIEDESLRRFQNLLDA